MHNYKYKFLCIINLYCGPCLQLYRHSPSFLSPYPGERGLASTTLYNKTEHCTGSLHVYTALHWTALQCEFTALHISKVHCTKTTDFPICCRGSRPRVIPSVQGERENWGDLRAGKGISAICCPVMFIFFNIVVTYKYIFSVKRWCYYYGAFLDSFYSKF